jgi:amino acid transporter
MSAEAGTLKRNMKAFGTLLITLSAITPTAGVFIMVPGIIQQAGSGAFLSFGLAAVIGIFMALVYAELSSAYPLTGGEYAIVGRVLGPFWGFIVLGLNIITLILIIAVIGLGIAPYLNVFFPSLSPIAAAILTIAISTFFGILNIRVNAVITGCFLAIEVLALVTLSMLGFEHVSRPLAEIAFHPVHLGAAGGLEPASLSLIGLATAVVIFAYNGYGQAVYLSEETRDASRHIARIILWALFITVIAEAVPVTAVLMGAPDLKALFSSPSMLSDFITQKGGPQLNRVVSLGVIFAILNASVAIILMIARQFFSTGRDHVWPKPVNRALTRIHTRFHSPWIATLVCSALAIGACFIDFNLLLVITGTSLVVIYAALCAATIAGRRNGSTRHAHYRMPLYPLPPIAGLIALAYVIYANYLDPAVGRPSLWATLGMILVSAAYYFLVLRRKGRWKLRGPAD